MFFSITKISNFKNNLLLYKRPLNLTEFYFNCLVVKASLPVVRCCLSGWIRGREQRKQRDGVGVEGCPRLAVSGSTCLYSQIHPLPRTRLWSCWGSCGLVPSSGSATGSTGPRAACTPLQGGGREGTIERWSGAHVGKTINKFQVGGKGR